MKFAQQLAKGRVEEWRRAYVDYRLLKKLIKAAAKSNEGPADGPGEDDSEVNRPLNLPATPNDSAIGESHAGDSSSDGNNAPPRQSTNVQPAPSGTRIFRIASRASEKSDVDTRQKKRSSRPGTASLREPRWKYPPNLSLDELMERLNPQERKFFQVLDSELEKVESFYDEREAEALARFKVLREQLDQLAEHRAEYLARQSKMSKYTKPLVNQTPSALRRRVLPGHDHSKATDGDDEGWNAHGDDDPRRSAMLRNHFNPENYLAARRKLKLAVFEFYKYLGYVKNYRLLNRTGFSKSTKKMEKVTNIKCQQAYMNKVADTHFASSTTIDDLQAQTESMFGASFEKGSRKKAVQRLRNMGSENTTHHFASWRAGVMLGLALPPLVDGIVKACQVATQERIPAYPSLLQLYGSMLLPVLLAFGIGINLVGWHNAHINIPLVFYFDTRTHIDFRQYLEIPSLLLCTLCYCFWFSFNVVSDVITPQVWPLVWLISMILIMFNPFPVFHKTARWWIIRSTVRVMTSGLVRVEFRDFWLGDQFASLYYTAYNIGLLVCVYAHHWVPAVNSGCSTNSTWTSPVLASLPYIWRLGQSIRRYHDSREVITHLINAGKYTASIVYFFVYFYYRIHGSERNGTMAAFIVFATLNSLYSYTWDILMDWNLFRRGSRHRFLRNELAYKNQIWFYYFAIVTNLILRFSWFIYFIDTSDLRLRGFIVALVETFRRWQWNFIRVESEHVGNVDGFRVTRDVPLPYTIAPPSSSVPGVVAEEDGTDDETVPMRGAEGFKPGEGAEPVPLGARRSKFEILLPGEVGRKLKSLIVSTSAGVPDDSDDEDSPATDSGARKRRDSGEDSSQDEGDIETARPDMKATQGLSQARIRNDFVNYQTFANDPEVERVARTGRTPSPA